MDKTSYYAVVFDTDSGAPLRLRIGRAKPGVTEGQARAALNGMIAANALDPSYGSLVSVRSLQFVTVSRTPFDVAS